MAKQDPVPKDDEGLATRLIHVKDTLPQFFAALGITAASPEVIEHGLDATMFRFVLDQQQRLVAAGEQSTKAKDRLRDGDLANPGQAVDLAFPGAPGTVPSPRLPGVVPRFRKFMKFLKGRTGYTEAIGEALKIVGDEEVMPDLSTVQPVISLRLIGGQVEVLWTKKQMTALELEVDRGDGLGSRFLTIDSVPNYIDTQPFPATAAKWKYRAIYRLKDARVGLWSAVSEITVG